MEWISVEENLPPQKWNVIVKNGKSIVYHGFYHYKKWYYWEKNLHKVTHWKYFEGGKPSIDPNKMRSYLKRAEKYRHQMQKRNFITSPLIPM